MVSTIRNFRIVQREEARGIERDGKWCSGKHFGRSILLGLEFLVAADIISTVAVKPTLDNVLVLGLIVLIRTFLSFSIDFEIGKRLPWQKK